MHETGGAVHLRRMCWGLYIVSSNPHGSVSLRWENEAQGSQATCPKSQIFVNSRAGIYIQAHLTPKTSYFPRKSVTKEWVVSNILNGFHQGFSTIMVERYFLLCTKVPNLKESAQFTWLSLGGPREWVSLVPYAHLEMVWESEAGAPCCSLSVTPKVPERLTGCSFRSLRSNREETVWGLWHTTDLKVLTACHIDKGVWSAGPISVMDGWTSSVEGDHESVRWQLCSLPCHLAGHAQWGVPEWHLWECWRRGPALGEWGWTERGGQRGQKPAIVKRGESKGRREEAQCRKEGRGIWEHSQCQSHSEELLFP